MNDQNSVKEEKNSAIPSSESKATPELKAAQWPKQLAAPLGLSEWECSNGDVYYQRSMAEARQRGLDKAEFDRATANRLFAEGKL